MSGGPLDVGTAVAALLALNGEEKPYELTSESVPVDAARDRAVVRALWKVWDVRWKSYFFNHGSDAQVYRLELTLDGSTGTYQFVEKQVEDTSRLEVSPLGVHGSKAKAGFRGKTWGQRQTLGVASREVQSTDADGNVTTGRSFSQTFRPADLKDPVFEALRGLGWRPPHDSRWSRLWEH